MFIIELSTKENRKNQIVNLKMRGGFMNRKWKKTLVWVLMILIFSIPLIAVAIKQQISNKDLSNEYTSVEQTLLEDWGLTPETTVSQLKESAQ